MLDRQSYQAIQQFSLQLGVGVGLLLVLATLGPQPAGSFRSAMGGMVQLYSLAACARAILARQPPGAGSLNHWDAAMAYCGCALLLHALPT